MDDIDHEEPVASLVELLEATALERQVALPDLSSSLASSYLDNLLSLPLSSLLTEAATISAESSTVESDLVNLCYREYPTFISVHRCSSAVTSAFDDFSSSLTRLLDAVPALEDECRQFSKSTAGVQAARARAALVAEHQDKLFDLLEIPQLMDTCVRNGYYHEALELATHAAALAARYPRVQLVADVAAEVETVLQLMLAQLLALLREPVKLPALIKAVGFLRRLGKMDDADLALAFIVGRAHNMSTHVVAIERDRADVVRYVRRYIDIFREHVFDIISQFSTIFLDSPAAVGAAAGADMADLLAAFAAHSVGELVAFVGANVPRMSADTAALSSILVQLGYCAMSFARVGLDFAPLVTEPFAAAVASSFAQAASAAGAALCKTLRDAGKAAAPPSHVLLSPDFVPLLLAPDVPPSITWSPALADVPADLARLPPLAVFVNAQLTALNALRLLAPYELRPLITSTLAAELTSCTAAIAQYVREACAALEPPVEPGRAASGGGHRRTPSSPRAHLMRRNSEGQMTPEARSAKRKEARRACWAFADAWANVVCPYLLHALSAGVYEGAADARADEPADLAAKLDDLRQWCGEVHEGKPEANGTAKSSGAAAREPVTPPAVDGHSSFVASAAAIPEEDEAVLAMPDVQPSPAATLPDGEARLDDSHVVDHDATLPVTGQAPFVAALEPVEDPIDLPVAGPSSSPIAAPVDLAHNPALVTGEPLPNSDRDADALSAQLEPVFAHGTSTALPETAGPSEQTALAPPIDMPDSVVHAVDRLFAPAPADASPASAVPSAVDQPAAALPPLPATLSDIPADVAERLELEVEAREIEVEGLAMPVVASTSTGVAADAATDLDNAMAAPPLPAVDLDETAMAAGAIDGGAREPNDAGAQPAVAETVDSAVTDEDVDAVADARAEDDDSAVHLQANKVADTVPPGATPDPSDPVDVQDERPAAGPAPSTTTRSASAATAPAVALDDGRASVDINGTTDARDAVDTNDAAAGSALSVPETRAALTEASTSAPGPSATSIADAEPARPMDVSTPDGTAEDDEPESGPPSAQPSRPASPSATGAAVAATAPAVAGNGGGSGGGGGGKKKKKKKGKK